MNLLTTDGDLHALGPEWDALWRRTPGAVPFQSPRWLLPWWRQFGTGQPHVATLRRGGGELAGILPLYVYEGRLLPIGAGLSDMLDVLAPGAEEATALLGFALNEAERRGIAACDLIELPPDARLLTAPSPWPATVQPSDPCPVLPLAPGLPAVPSRQLRKLRMSRHRAERAGGWRVSSADAGSLPALQDRLFVLHQARWTTQGQPGVFADGRVAALHREAGPALLEAGLLRVGAVHLRGSVAAVIAALLAPDAIHFYLSGFDAVHAFESPGTVLLGAMLEEAAAEGRTEANFLRGAETYKYAWGAADRPNVMRLLRRPEG